MQPSRYGTTLAAIFVVLIVATGFVAAHESATVGSFELTFGGSDEPVITGERMWMQVEILDAETGEPVEGAGDSIEMAVQRPFGDGTFELDVSAVHGRLGWYEGAVVFTEPGTYTIYISAQIDGETFETSFQKQVHNASTLRYPPPPPTGEDKEPLSASIGFGLGVVIAAVGMAGAFLVGRRKQGPI